MNSNKWDESHCRLNQLHSLFLQRQVIGQCELNHQVATPITHRTVSELRIEKKKAMTYVEKSAEAVAARKALVSKQQLHTAPLCPSNVPIQSPVSPFLSIGLESEHQAKTQHQIFHYTHT